MELLALGITYFVIGIVVMAVGMWMILFFREWMHARRYIRIYLPYTKAKLTVRVHQEPETGREYFLVDKARYYLMADGSVQMTIKDGLLDKSDITWRELD